MGYVPIHAVDNAPWWWDKNQTRTLVTIELPAYDPLDRGIGSMRHKEGVAIAQIFNDRWQGPVKPTVTSITRIQNIILYDKFYMKLSELDYVHAVNEKWMFHGTKSTEVVDAIVEHGFDTRVAEQGLRGAGIYAAENSDVANIYTCPDYKKIRYCIYGRFMHGAIEEIPKGQMLMSTYRRGSTYSVFHPKECRMTTRTYDSQRGQLSLPFVSLYLFSLLSRFSLPASLFSLLSSLFSLLASLFSLPSSLFPLPLAS